MIEMLNAIFTKRDLVRDKFLTEAMGDLWFCHEKSCGFNHTSGQWITTYCTTNNFSTPEGFIKLWNWCMTQKWWFELWERKLCDPIDWRFHGFNPKFVNPDLFADTVYEFLKER